MEGIMLASPDYRGLPTGASHYDGDNREINTRSETLRVSNRKWMRSNFWHMCMYCAGLASSAAQFVRLRKIIRTISRAVVLIIH